MTERYDAIVVGLGIMGSAATYHLAKRGQRVLGIDTFPEGHDQGSSHGHHRLIRRSHANPQFRPLVDRAFELWRTLEDESSQKIMSLIGEVSMNHEAALNSAGWLGIGAEAENHLEPLDEDELRQQFSGFRLQPGMTATYEREAGYVLPEPAMSALLRVAERNGAVIHRPEEVTHWSADGDGVRVETTHGSYKAGRLVITAGPWAAEQLRGLGLPLQVVRIVNAYYRPERPDLWTAEKGAPNFTMNVPEGEYYGMPSIAGQGLKIGRHDLGEPTTARTIGREVGSDEVEHLRRILDTYMPGASGPCELAITCMYTMTPDENYIVERHPFHSQVAYACGFSGTGFKFGPVIGEILADLITDVPMTSDSSMFSSARFTKKDNKQGVT
ncbi:N-methyl-L-tryptophan oxidase [Pseudarthrobacter sp. SSS035]|uniref:N-methyl-L-tryptophan oxidase n=1 Tax=Pseudarthrobacter sp. SSS035 TaxID=2931399 RepID=UPI00200C1D1D|nr:N-methyl-L-tryptophan oxidase [Pseudarthrobacter sp. SSS035]